MSSRSIPMSKPKSLGVDMSAISHESNTTAMNECRAIENVGSGGALTGTLRLTGPGIRGTIGRTIHWRSEASGSGRKLAGKSRDGRELCRLGYVIAVPLRWGPRRITGTLPYSGGILSRHVWREENR